MPQNKYKTIHGHRNFKSWCHEVLHRTDRTVRYMLQKSKNEGPKTERKAETISAVLDRCTSYIRKQDLDELTRSRILKILIERSQAVTPQNFATNSNSSGRTFSISARGQSLGDDHED